MESFWKHPPSLLIDGLYDVMPEAAKVLFDEGIRYISSGNYHAATAPILMCLKLVMDRFAEGVSHDNGGLGQEPALSVLRHSSANVSPELLYRLEFIRRSYQQPESGPQREFLEHEVEYLIVSCIDVCERMLSDDRYRPLALN